MANQRLFPEQKQVDKREPQERFDETASKVFSLPKSEIDKREKAWRKNKAQTE